MSKNLVGTILLCVAAIGVLHAVGWLLGHYATVLVVLGVLVIAGRWVWFRTENWW